MIYSSLQKAVSNYHLPPLAHPPPPPLGDACFQFGRWPPLEKGIMKISLKVLQAFQWWKTLFPYCLTTSINQNRKLRDWLISKSRKTFKVINNAFWKPFPLIIIYKYQSKRNFSNFNSSSCIWFFYTQHCQLHKKWAWTKRISYNNHNHNIFALWQQKSLSYHICVLHLAGSVCIAPRIQSYPNQQHGWRLVWSGVPIATWNWCGEHQSNTSVEPVKSMNESS